MPRKYNRITKEELAPIVESSISYAECLRKLGLVNAGGNYAQLQRRIDKFDLDCTHFLGQAANQGREFITFDNLVSKESIKKRLIKERSHQCESCDNTHWLEQVIMLELEHVDGNNRNNDRSNLLLLCPNCHAQSSTWRNRKRIV